MCHTEILNNFVPRMGVLLILLLSMPSCVWATSTGSNSAPSREAFVTYSGTGNTINGFAGMYNGFALTNNTTAVTFNSSFPVGTFMSLSGGALTLSQDLILDSSLIFGSPGTIVGNIHDVAFAPQTKTIPLPNLGAINLLNSQNTGLGGTNSTDWSGDNKYVAVGTGVRSGAGPEIQIYAFNGVTLTLTASAYLNLTVNQIAWRPVTSPSSYYLVAGTSGGLFAYQFTPPSTLVATSTIDTPTNFQEIAWHPSGNTVATGIYPATVQQLALYDFNALTGSLTNKLNYSFSASLFTYGGALDFDYSGSYLAAGFINTINPNGYQLQVLSWDGTSLQLTASTNTVSGPSGVHALGWAPDGTAIAVAGAGPGGANCKLQIFAFNRTSQSLGSSYSVAIDNSSNFLAWSPNGRNIAVMTNTGGYSLQLFAVNSIKHQLLLVSQLSGGQGLSASWTSDNNYLVTGQGNNVNVFNFIGPMNLQNTNLVFSSPVQLLSSFVFSGLCTIDCNGYTLDLNSQIITVTTGASLLFNNVVLEGFTGTNLQCVDSTGTVSFRDTTCVVNNTMQWSQGSLAIIGDCTMTGTGTFIYSSSQASTIYHGATWYFDRGMNFRYYPQSNLNNLLNFADSTAQLYLYETALHAQSAGLQFAKGTLAIEGRCPFYSDALTPANGILFGDNISSINNVNVMLLPESGIDCRSGYVVDQNIGG